MDGNYLIPANTKRGQLIFGLFRELDLIIFGVGVTLSFVLMFCTFWIIDKLVGIEKIGGADIKILFILALTITMWDSLMLVILSFFVDVLIFLFAYPIHKIFKKEGAVKIPMIVAISLSWILLCFMQFNI